MSAMKNSSKNFSSKRKFNLAIITLLVLLLTACAAVDYSQQAVFPQAKTDQALIYFYRTPGFIGSTYRFNVSQGDKLVGAMAQDSYFYLFTDSGEHIFSVNDQYQQPGSLIKINVQAGKVYYIRVDIESQFLTSQAVFTEVDQSEAEALLSSRKYVVPSIVKSSTYNIHAEQ